MRRAGYDTAFAAAVTLSSSVVGPLVPPSVVMIIYAIVAEVSIGKLYWAQWHRALGELALDVAGAAGLVTDGPPYELTDLQRLFLFSRADTIYAGSNQIQRNIIGERVLGLPREPR